MWEAGPCCQGCLFGEGAEQRAGGPGRRTFIIRTESGTEIKAANPKISCYYVCPPPYYSAPPQKKPVGSSASLLQRGGQGQLPSGRACPSGLFSGFDLGGSCSRPIYGDCSTCDLQSRKRTGGSAECLRSGQSAGAGAPATTLLGPQGSSRLSKTAQCCQLLLIRAVTPSLQVPPGSPREPAQRPPLPAW